MRGIFSSQWSGGADAIAENVLQTDRSRVIAFQEIRSLQSRHRDILQTATAEIPKTQERRIPSFRE